MSDRTIVIILAGMAGVFGFLAVLVARHPTSLTSSAAAPKIELVPRAAAAASSVSWQPSQPRCSAAGRRSIRESVTCGRR